MAGGTENMAKRVSVVCPIGNFYFCIAFRWDSCPAFSVTSWSSSARICWYVECLFFIINIAKIPFYMEIGIFTGETIQISLWLMLVIPVGVLIGRWLNQNMIDQICYDFSHFVLLGIGGRLLFSVL